MQSTNSNEDINLVEIWLRKDKKRWAAGVMAGITAGLVAVVVGMFISVLVKADLWIALKGPAMVVLGASAMNYGVDVKTLITGLIVWEVLAAFLGFLYAHFTGTNRFVPLLGVGLTWGAFTWIFIHNLFIQSNRVIFVQHISYGAAFFFCMAYGISLTTVSLFDRMLKK